MKINLINIRGTWHYIVDTFVWGPQSRLILHVGINSLCGVNEIYKLSADHVLVQSVWCSWLRCIDNAELVNTSWSICNISTHSIHKIYIPAWIWNSISWTIVMDIFSFTLILIWTYWTWRILVPKDSCTFSEKQINYQTWLNNMLIRKRLMI